jgi:hypothetical protein
MLFGMVCMVWYGILVWYYYGVICVMAWCGITQCTIGIPKKLYRYYWYTGSFPLIIIKENSLMEI